LQRSERLGQATAFVPLPGSPNRLRYGYGGPPERHAKAEGLRYGLRYAFRGSPKGLRYSDERDHTDR
jgi:hypothetical protein